MNLATKCRTVALLMAVSPLAYGQQAVEKDRSPTSTQESTQTAGKTEHDAMFAGCLIIDSQVEVALAEIAQTRAESQEVKEFAKKVIEDHNKFVTSLRKHSPNGPHSLQSGGERTGRAGETGVASQQKGRNPATDSQPDASRENRDRVATGQEARGATGQPDMLAVKTEVAQKCVQSISKILQEKQGPAFDQCYMAQQFFAHVQMIDMLTVVKGHVSSELQETLAQGLQVVEQHKEHAERILGQLDKNTLAQAKRDTGIKK